MSGSFIKAASHTVFCTEEARTIWLHRPTNSADITGTALTDVLGVTNLKPGRWNFTCILIYQTTATTTGIDVAVNFSGTQTQFLVEHRFASTGSPASTAAATEAASATTGAMYESQGSRTVNGIIGGGTVSVDALDTDMMSTIEGVIYVTVAGDFAIRMAAENAGLVCRCMQSSFLEMRRFT